MNKDHLAFSQLPKKDCSSSWKIFYFKNLENTVIKHQYKMWKI